MAFDLSNSIRKTLRCWGSLKTGIILLLITGIAFIIGTLVLQRPITEPEKLEQAYSPQTLALLDRLGMTDVFHAWWFVALMALLSGSIILASVERFPQVWRFFSRPYKRTDAHFRRVLPARAEVAIPDANRGLVATEKVLHRFGFRPQRIEGEGGVSLFAEKNRFALLAAYVTHISLLLIFTGGMIDALWGFKGYITLSPGETKSEYLLRDGSRDGKVAQLPFALRCDGTGQENYPDGTPSKWWSKLAVVEDGKQSFYKEIVVNDPLTWKGLRFYQSGWGYSDQLEDLHLMVRTRVTGVAREVVLKGDAPAQMEDGATLKMVRFIPDAFLREGQIYQRSTQVNNPGVQLAVTDKSGASSMKWVFPQDSIVDGSGPYDMVISNLHLTPYTGLQIAYQPGQTLVWMGCLGMFIALSVAFTAVHTRLWAAPVINDEGKLVLWLGTASNKNRESVTERFEQMVAAVREELGAAAPPSKKETVKEELAGVAGR